MKKKQIGLLGGSFDPLHLGHLNLAIEMIEKRNLDEIWWIPAFQNPLKRGGHVAASHRLNMLKVAFKGLPFFRIIDFEIKRPFPSYTIDTVRHLKSVYKDDFFLILGDDTLTSFNKWKEPEALVKLAPPLIANRIGNVNDALKPYFARGLTKIRRFEVSSTEVRERLLNRQYVGHLVPGEVLYYIYKHNLYLQVS